jgi:hypothetical protein
MARTWAVSGSGGYAINKNVSNLLVNGQPINGQLGGHSITGDATLTHTMGEQLSVAFHYDRIHESYSGITAIELNPDANRETVSITWQFQRPLGK